MKTRWMLTWAALLTSVSAATAQVYDSPGPSSTSEPTAPVPPSRSMPRDVQYDAPPAVMSVSPAISQSYGTSCAWDECGSSAGSFYGGVGVSWLRPVWQRNPAVARIGNQGGVNVIGTTDHDWDLRTAPTAFLGYRRADGLGIRARWWEFNQNTATNFLAGADTLVTARPLNTGLTAPLGGSIFAESGLDMCVFDLELTHDIALDGWTLTVGVGGRYAQLDQSHNTFAATNALTPAGAVVSSQCFDGYGATVSLGARHNLAGSLVLYGVGRGSLLYGRSA